MGLLKNQKRDLFKRSMGPWQKFLVGPVSICRLPTFHPPKSVKKNLRQNVGPPGFSGKLAGHILIYYCIIHTVENTFKILCLSV